MRRAAILAFVLPVALLATSSGADEGERFHPPQGCTGKLTVQSRGCELDNIWTCEADAPGENWRAVFTAEGLVYLSKIDAETQWLETYDMFPTSSERLVQPAPDPASLTELLETGTDTYDFRMQTSVGPVRYVGFDRLTGEQVAIDGEPLLPTEFRAEVTPPDGATYTVHGNEYVSVTHRRFIGGTRTYTEADGTSWDVDNSPVEFIYPGEPGFFSRVPEYDCDATLARFTRFQKGPQQ